MSALACWTLHAVSSVPRVPACPEARSRDFQGRVALALDWLEGPTV